MRRITSLRFAAGILALLPLPSYATDLALQRIMLSSAGVGYFEYAAEVEGTATLDLDVPLEQVDDVLKSLVVFDSAGGVGGVELPGHDGARSAFGQVPFGPEALGSALDLLNALQGVEIEVRGPHPVTGRVLRAERVREPAGTQPDGGVQRTRVTLLGQGGLQQFILEDAESVQVADPVLRARIEKALEALRRDEARATRHLTLRSTGTTRRTVRVGYVAAAPLWKASYRLVLPSGNAAGARLQGWAVLENASGADWHGVELALQYGNPVTFRQAIYRTYYVQRPEVPVEVLGRILPEPDRGGQPVRSMASNALAPAPLAAPAAKATTEAQPDSGMASMGEGVAAGETAEETVFVLPTKLDLPAGHTASVPILDATVAAERVGVLSAGRAHPLAALRVRNDSPTSLPAGVLALYDLSGAVAFAGDAQLAGLPRSEQRLLSFAEDLRTRATWDEDDSSTIAGVAAAQGVLRLEVLDRHTTRFTVTAPAAEPRTLIVEIPRRPGAKLSGDATAEEALETVWRIRVQLNAGETRNIAMHQDVVERQETSLVEDRDVLARVLGSQALSPAARAALQTLADLRAEEAGRAAERDRLKAELAQVEADEERIRRNLASVPANDALHARLVRALDQDETRIESLQDAIGKADVAAQAAQQKLAEAAAAFRL
jgi:hypothetical protein